VRTAETFPTVLFIGPRSYSAVLSRIVPFWMPAESAHSGESTQHSLEVWSQQSRNLNFFWDADLGLQVQTAFCPKMAKDGFAHVPSLAGFDVRSLLKSLLAMQVAFRTVTSTPR
jgi:hypothetical protein